jgi:hypothetical protein
MHNNKLNILGERQPIHMEHQTYTHGSKHDVGTAETLQQVLGGDLCLYIKLNMLGERRQIHMEHQTWRHHTAGDGHWRRSSSM